MKNKDILVEIRYQDNEGEWHTDEAEQYDTARLLTTAIVNAGFQQVQARMKGYNAWFDSDEFFRRTLSPMGGHKAVTREHAPAHPMKHSSKPPMQKHKNHNHNK